MLNQLIHSFLLEKVSPDIAFSANCAPLIVSAFLLLSRILIRVGIFDLSFLCKMACKATFWILVSSDNAYLSRIFADSSPGIEAMDVSNAEDN